MGDPSRALFHKAKGQDGGEAQAHRHAEVKSHLSWAWSRRALGRSAICIRAPPSMPCDGEGRGEGKDRGRREAGQQLANGTCTLDGPHRGLSRRAGRGEVLCWINERERETGVRV